MLSLPPPWLVVIGIAATAFAQILLKESSHHGVMGTAWLVFMVVAAASYALSFLLYALALKTYPLNKIYPTMTIAQLAIVTVYGLAVGEAIDLRHAAGLTLAVISIYLILG